MKYFVFAVVISVFITSCSVTQNTSKDLASNQETKDTLRIANDSLEYEIVIIEPGFNAWLSTQPPRGYYSEQFLETRNRQYVWEYNQRVLNPYRFNPNLYLQQINYNRSIHYGYEVNYLLYNYFLFFEERFDQKFTMTRG